MGIWSSTPPSRSRPTSTWWCDMLKRIWKAFQGTRVGRSIFRVGLPASNLERAAAIRGQAPQPPPAAVATGGVDHLLSVRRPRDSTDGAVVEGEPAQVAARQVGQGDVGGV